MKTLKSRILLASAIMLLGGAFSYAPLNAAPAKRASVYFTQPDGSSFRGYIRGDEFCHVKSTLSGRPIAQNSEGWWCYASYSADGHITISETHVNQTDASLLTTSGTSASPLPAPSGRRAAFNRITGERLAATRRYLGTEGGPVTKAASLQKEKHGIVILAQFKDMQFRYKKENFKNMLSQTGYSFGGATGSAKDYFDSQFGGSVEFSFDVSDIVQLPENVEYYGGNDSDGNDRNAVQMAIDACRGAADAGVDFSKYDDDNDGYVDNVFIVFAGGDEADGAGDNCIWAHAYYIESGEGQRLELCGKKIDSYACASELTPTYEEFGGGYGLTYTLSGIGTFCHEYSHTFGLPDLYDTDYQQSGGQSEALWTATGLMDGGNSNNGGNTPPNYNAIDRECLGIGEAMSLKDGDNSLEPINRAGKYYRVDTDTKNEYFLIECRSSKELWDSYIGGDGMLVYHIDKSGNDAGKSDTYGMKLTAAQRWNVYNEVNCRPDRQCADLIEADPKAVSQARRGTSFYPTESLRKRIFFPYGNYNTIGPAEGLKSWEGNSCGVQIYGISLSDEGSISFTVSQPKEMSASVEKSIFQNNAILEISTSNVEGEISVKYGISGKTLSSEVKANPREYGKYLLKLDNLSSKQAYKAEIYAAAAGGAMTKIGSTSFTTKAATGAYPLIYVRIDGRNADGTFNVGTKIPLVLSNGSAAKEVKWYFKGKELSAGEDIYLTVKESGELKAVLTFSDGVQTSICKEIVAVEKAANE